MKGKETERKMKGLEAAETHSPEHNSICGPFAKSTLGGQLGAALQAFQKEGHRRG